MKTLFLLALCVVLISSNSSAQTKGTNAVGLGFSIHDQETKSNINEQASDSEVNGIGVNLGYGRFIKENAKVKGFLIHSRSTSINTFNNISSEGESKAYGGGLGYQKYYPLVKKFFAYVDGGGLYTYTKLEDNKINQYSLGVSGGLTYFVFKHWAVEVSLLSLSASYITRTTTESFPGQSTTNSSSFGLSSSGNINDLGFSVQFLF